MAILVTGPTVAQESERVFEVVSPSDALFGQRTTAQLLDEAVRNSRRALVDMYKKRDFNPFEVIDVEQNEQACPLPLSSDSTYRASEDIGKILSSRFPAETAVLIYDLTVFRDESKPDQSSTNDMPSLLCSWLVDRSGIIGFSAIKLKRTGELERAILELSAALGVSQGRSVRGVTSRDVRIAQQSFGTELRSDSQAIEKLSLMLFPEAIRPSLSSVKQLMIVPIQRIGIVPFACLRPFGTNEFLIDRMIISTLPNLFDLAREQSRWEGSFHAPLVVGNPDFSSLKSLSSLPGAEREASKVALLVNAHELTGIAATRRTILEQIEQRDLLYFATHGISDSNKPLDGGYLVFAGENENESIWTARQIQSAKLNNCKLVVLSACQTGLGQAHDAGIIGLARAFQLAGAERVLMSLWSVNDDSTSKLMQLFMKHTQQQPPASALRSAIKEFRSQEEHQSNLSDWASFALFGPVE